jgi:hypothetical protein
MHKNRLLCAALLGLCGIAAAGAGLRDFYWRDEFADADRFTAQRTWLSNPSDTASVATDGEAACFRVDEAQKGMKWSAPMPAVSLAETPWLALRYRAENLNTGSTDYLVYLDDGVAGTQLNAVRLADVVADGKWHAAAVDVSALTSAEAVRGFAIQVQANPQGKARLWLDWLTLRRKPPTNAEVLRQAQPPPAARPDWTAPLEKATWEPKPGWLPNPASDDQRSVTRQEDITTFRVAEPGRGMKWAWSLPEEVPLEGHRYVAMRYRATRLRPAGGYALCVIGKPRGDGRDYTPVIEPSELIADGRWHTVAADIRGVAREFPAIGAFALQVQAAEPDATLELAAIRLVNAVPPSKLSDFIAWQPGAKFEDTQPVPIPANSPSAPWREHLRLADWFADAQRGAAVPHRKEGSGAEDDRVAQPPSAVLTLTAEGLPFCLRAQPPDLAATGIRSREELRIPCKAKASEVYVLLLAALVGPEEEVYGGGRFKAIRDVDRFRLRLTYADGTADECLPMNAATDQFAITEGPQVLVAAADPAKTLTALALRDICKQAAFAVAAVTARTAGAPRFPAALEETPPLHMSVGPTVRRPAEFEKWMNGFPIVRRLTHPETGWQYLSKPVQMLAFSVDGEPVPPERFELRAQSRTSTGKLLSGEYSVEMPGDLSAQVYVMRALQPWDFPGYDIVLGVNLTNADSKAHKIAVDGPRLGPYRLSREPDDAYYLLPRRGAAFDNRSCSYRERYCGLFPVQFIDSFSPRQRCGLSFRAAGRNGLRKHVFLKKKGNEFTLGVQYREFVVQPGETLSVPPCVFTLHDGNWHRGLEAYRKWLRTWHKPLSPRKPWFREIFNFRQRFLHAHDPLYDPKTGTYRMAEGLAEDRREFGGVDYLHLFDWGNCGPHGRIYGRTGDYSPYDYLKGGRAALREAIAGVQEQGIPVGLYIEGYLLTARGKLGQAHGEDWQIAKPDGSGLWWAGEQEMMVCPGVEEWREVQASTYETKVTELGVDGMYIDQFGFANAWKDCYAADHGHAVPSYPVRTEREMTKLIRQRVEAVTKGVAIYTEETPVDGTTAFQDGSFTYAMNAARRTQTLVPINIARFAFPDFKTIEILICDKPTGSWATGVRWVFFNGEALWIEGPPKWFEPQTRAEIRRCHRILRKHRDAFTSLEPVPLRPTEMGGVWANEFPVVVRGDLEPPSRFSKVVYTLYNARHRTVRGEVLRVPHVEGTTYYDEWHQRKATVRIEGGEAVLATELGPHGTGCLVVERERSHAEEAEEERSKKVQ